VCAASYSAGACVRVYVCVCVRALPARRLVCAASYSAAACVCVCV